MIRFANITGTQDRATLNAVLKAGIERLDAALLPLQAGLSHSSYVSDEPFRAMVIGVTEAAGRLQVRAGIFYRGVIAGCNCADDPTPVDTQTEYCEVILDIDRRSGEATVTLAAD